HRNVVGFRGCGVYPERAPRGFYLAMEYVPGRQLGQWVEEENPSARRAAELLRGMARGLEATHAAAVLHRDIKESNIVVRDADGEPVLVDYGVGDYAGAPRLTSGVLPPGTPRYRSPEALAFRRDSRPGQRERYMSTPGDDLYALGVVFYWVLTGRHPFPAVETSTEVEAVITHEPVAPHVLNPRVPLELSGLCMRLLSKHPEARGDARRLGDDAEAVLARADVSWDVPLGEPFSEGPVDDGRGAWRREDARDSEASWEDSREALEAWVRQGVDAVGPPRRGRRPRPTMVPLDGAGLAAVGESALEVRAPLATTSKPPHRGEVLFRVWAVVGMTLGLGLAVLLSLDWQPSARLVDLTGAMTGAVAGREVAPAGAPPESERAAAPPLAVLPPAAVATSAASPQEEAVPVNEKKTSDAPATPTKPRALKSLSRVVKAAAVCTGLACAGSSSQLRPPPPSPESCPPGAVEAMAKLGIKLGAEGGVSFVGLSESEQVVTVRDQQRVRVQVGASLGLLKAGTLAGQLFLGDRVYGRYTEGYLKKSGERIPVCFQIMSVENQRWKLGTPIEPDGYGEGTARVWSRHYVIAVDHFD
ncbi:protein kinase, partial [Pyxidicoccus fallax]